MQGISLPPCRDLFPRTAARRPRRADAAAAPGGCRPSGCGAGRTRTPRSPWTTRCCCASTARSTRPACTVRPARALPGRRPLSAHSQGRRACRRQARQRRGLGATARGVRRRARAGRRVPRVHGGPAAGRGRRGAGQRGAAGCARHPGRAGRRWRRRRARLRLLRLALLARVRARPAPPAALLHAPRMLTANAAPGRGWRRRGGRGSAAASPTEGIACPHGGLLPQAAGAKARRQAVPPLVWQHLLAANGCGRARSRLRIPRAQGAPNGRVPPAGTATATSSCWTRTRARGKRARGTRAMAAQVGARGARAPRGAPRAPEPEPRDARRLRGARIPRGRRRRVPALRGRAVARRVARPGPARARRGRARGAAGARQRRRAGAQILTMCRVPCRGRRHGRPV